MSSLPKILNVAEKNDAAKELAKVMSGGRFQRREGFSKYNKIYEFDLHILGANHRMVMTSVSGHLMSLDFIPTYRNWKNCMPLKLFDAQIEKTVQDDFIPIKNTIHREIRGCNDVILWTDGDREGEGIAQEIVDVCYEVRKRLRVHRARFSEITYQSVRRACDHLTTLDRGMVDAVETRQELDLRIGCAFTRFQTIRLRNVFPQILSDNLVSYGPCQFPTLGFVVDRYKEIQAFIPETFYRIKVTHHVESSKVEFNWKRVRLFNHTCCLILYQICMENPIAHVVDINSRPRSKWRPLPLDTVELEKLCSRKLRINAKETMRIAEKLYTQGYLSYPRTETNIFPPSFDLVSLIREQTQDYSWGGFAANLMTTGPNPRQGNKSDNAHPPIHPVRYTNTLTGNEKRIYEFVVRHFLACCSKNAEGQETKVEISVGGERFTAKGLMITAKNYLDVYTYENWSDKTLPRYNINDTFNPTSIEMNEGETSPPSLLQEADLIALMDKHGIGTDATHSEHIETIKSRSYVGVLNDGSFVPGELGIGLVEGYDSMGYQLSKPKLRAELESDLKRICDGQQTREIVVKRTLDKYKSVFVQANQQAHKLDEALSQYFGTPRDVTLQEENDRPLLSESVRKCPICLRSDLVIKKKRDGGFMLSCISYPQCTASQYFPNSVADAEPHATEICHQCTPGPVSLVKLTFQPGSVPPFMNINYTGCTTCDEHLINALDFRPIRESNISTNSNTPSRGGGRGQGIQLSQSSGRGQYSGRGNRDDWQPSPNRGRGLGRGLGRGRGEGRGFGRGSSPVSTSRVGRIGGGVGGVVCMCGIEAVLLTVRNEQSSNKGRQFYKCAKREENEKCGFFLWADESTDTVPSSFIQSEGSCQCGLQVARKTVQNGPNQGRPFLTCPKPRDQQCGYFAWADNNTNNRGRFTGTSRGGFTGPNRGGFSRGGPRGGFTGPNRGGFTGPRGGFTGPSRGGFTGPRGGFSRGGPRGSYRGSFNGKSHGRPSPSIHEEEPAAKRRAPPTCSICHLPGHTKRTCPNGH